jgi:FAD/FMN-containing dehydrogenase
VNLIVSTARLDKIIEHEPADLVAIAEAGVTLNNFNAALAQQGQWLAIDPPNDGRVTLGGAVATGLGGAQQFGYGPPRKHVIGMKVVMADGRLIKAGGRVVKNVAGYDLCKLFTRSYGTLGIIVEVNFKLRPLPTKTRSLLAVGTQKHLLATAKRVIDAPLFPVAVELVSPRFAGEANWSDGKDHLLLIRFAGSASAVAHQTGLAQALMDGGPGREADGGANQETLATDDTTIWESLAAMPLKFQDQFSWRASFPPAELGRFLDEMQKGDERDLLWQAGVGDGRVRVVERLPQSDNGPSKFSNETVARMVSRIETLRGIASSAGGSLIVENAPPELKRVLNPWGKVGSSAVIMKRIKTELDPDGIFPPGRFD